MSYNSVTDTELLNAYGSLRHTRSESDHMTDLRAVRRLLDARWEAELDDKLKHMALALGLPTRDSKWEDLRAEAVRLRKQVAPADGLLESLIRVDGLLESTIRRNVEEQVAAHLREALPVALTAALDAYEKARKA